jgi:hypothetical protein
MTTILFNQDLPSPARQQGAPTSLMRCCRGCVFHSAPLLLGKPFHLCILPPDCGPPVDHDDGSLWHDEDRDGRTYLGTSCDVMRRMGAACGPRASMWLDAQAAEKACRP